MAGYEVGKATLSVTPDLTGISGKLSKQFSKIAPQINSQVAQGITGGVKSAAPTVKSSMDTSWATQAGLSAGRRMGSAMADAIKSATSGIGRAVGDSIKVAGSAAVAGIGTIATQAVMGGGKRELQITDANAKLLAMGNSAAKVSSIMENITEAINGTQYAMGEAAKVSSQLLAAGTSPGEEMTRQLKQIVKLSDMAGISFEEMGSIYSKNLTAGLMYAEDLNQLNDRGISIYGELAKSMGVSATEVKKIASDGKLEFSKAQKAFDDIEFDSAVFASKSIEGSFKNLRAQISMIGGDFLSPMLKGLPQIFGTLRGGLKNLRGNKGFQDFLARANALTQDSMDTVARWAKNFENAMNSSKVGDFFDALIEKVAKFKQLIKDKELLALGTGAGVFGALMQNIPIIGGLFSRINPLVGFFIGGISQLTKNSEAFRSAIGGLWEGLKKLGGGIYDYLTPLLNIEGAIDLSNIKVEGLDTSKVFEKFDFNAIGSAIGQNIESFVTKIKTYGAPIKEAIGGIVDTIGETFSSISKGSDGSLGEALATLIGGGLTLALQAVNNVLPIIVNVTKVAKDIATSDITKGIFGFLVDAMSFLLNNKVALYAGMAILTSIIAGKMLSKVLGLAKIVQALGKVAGYIPMAKKTGGLGKAIGGFGAGLVRGMTMIGQAVVTGAPYIAALGGLVLALGGIIALLDKMGTFDALLKVGEGVKTFIVDILKEIIPTFGQIVQIVGATISSVFSAIAQNVPLVIDAITRFAEAVGGLFLGAMNSFKGLIETLATSGVQASAGAVALSGALLGLGGAIAGLLLAMAGGTAASGLAGLITGEGAGISTLTSFISELGRVSDSIKSLPQDMNSIVPQATIAGAMVGTSYVNAMKSAINGGRGAIKSEVRSILQDMQHEIDKTPLRVKMEVDRSGVGRAGSGGNTYNNTSNTFRVNNAVNFERLMRRGV